MTKSFYRMLVVALCAVLVIGTASDLLAQEETREEIGGRKKLTERERIEMGKKVSLTRVLRSGDARLIFDEGYKLYSKGTKNSWSKAYQLFDAVQHYFTGTRTEDSVMFFRARCKFKSREYDEATTLLDEYRRRYGGGDSPFIEDAEGMYALCYYYMSPDPEHDQTITRQAIVTITEFMSRYPQSSRLDDFRTIITELTQRLHDKAFQNAYTYYKIGRHKSAIVAFKNVMKRCPDSPRYEDMMYYTTVAAYRLASNSVADKQVDRYLAMIDHYYSFIGEFPDSKHCKELGRMAKDARNFIDKKRKTEQ